MRLPQGWRVIEAETPSERRRHRRKDALWWGEIELPAGTFECRVFNVSVAGAKVRTMCEVTGTPPLVLAIPPFGRFSGRVRWTAYPFLGIRFADAEHDRLAQLITAGLNELPE